MSAVANLESTVGDRIFLKNLEKSVDNKCLFDTFAVFGEIVCCEVSVDEEGASRGYAFVQFETEKAAQKAVLEGNGMIVSGKKMFVEKFKTRAELTGESGNTFTNVFVKNFGEELDDVKLKTIFEVFGETTSCVVMRDANNKSKGFGFVAFKNAENAENAVVEMHGKTLKGSGRQLFVCRAQKKSERQAELRRQFEPQDAEVLQDAPELYVKNLNSSIDDEGLTKMFAEFGNVTSVKILRCKNGRSRGKGFVRFENVGDAKRAMNSMNSKIVGFKTLYVTLAQSKEDSLAQVASQKMECMAKEQMISQFPVVPMYAPVHHENASALQNKTVFFPGNGFVAPLMGMAQHGVVGMDGQQEFVPHNVGCMSQRVEASSGSIPGNEPPQQCFPRSVVLAPLLSSSSFGGPSVPMHTHGVLQPSQVRIYPAPTYAMHGPQVMDQEMFTQLSSFRLEIDAKRQEPSTTHVKVDEAVPVLHQSEINRQQA